MPNIEGLVKLGIRSARDLANTDSVSRKSDPYVTFSLGKREIARTHVIKETLLPVWEFELDFFCKGKFLQGTAFTFTVYDSDAVTSTFLGTAHLAVEELLTKPKDSLNLPLQFDLRESKGTLLIDYEYTPTPSAPDGVKVVEVDNVQNDPVSGIVRLYIERARELKKTDRFRKSDPYVSVRIPRPSDVKKLARTPVIKNTQLPVWEFRDEVFISGVFLDDTPFEFHVFDEDKFSKDPLGKCEFPIYELFERKKIDGKRALQLPGKDPEGELYFEATFEDAPECPEGMRKVNVGDLFYLKWKKEGYKPPEGGVAAGTVRNVDPEINNPPVRGIFTCGIEEASGGALDKKSDPYVILYMDKTKLAVTHTISNTHHPVWNREESFVFEGTFLNESKLTFALHDGSKVVGKYDVRVYDFVEKKKLKEKLELVDDAGAATGIKLKVECAFKPLKEDDDVPEKMRTVDCGDLVYRRWKKEGKKL